MNQLRSQLEEVEGRLATLKKASWEHHSLMQDRASLKLQINRLQKQENSASGLKEFLSTAQGTTRRAQRERRWRDSDQNDLRSRNPLFRPEAQEEKDEGWTAAKEAKREAEQHERQRSLEEGRELERQPHALLFIFYGGYDSLCSLCTAP